MLEASRSDQSLLSKDWAGSELYAVAGCIEKGMESGVGKNQLASKWKPGRTSLTCHATPQPGPRDQNATKWHERHIEKSYSVREVAAVAYMAAQEQGVASAHSAQHSTGRALSKPSCGLRSVRRAQHRRTWTKPPAAAPC